MYAESQCSFKNIVPVLFALLSAVKPEQTRTDIFTGPGPEAARWSPLLNLLGAWGVLSWSGLFSLSTVLLLTLSLASKKTEIYCHHFTYFSKYMFEKKLNFNIFVPKGRCFWVSVCGDYHRNQSGLPLFLCGPLSHLGNRACFFHLNKDMPFPIAALC